MHMQTTALKRTWFNATLTFWLIKEASDAGDSGSLVKALQAPLERVKKHAL
jgi:hypothetical protein